MGRISLIAFALGILLATGCSSQEMQALQQKCNSGDKSACSQLAAPGSPMPLPMSG